ncbi:hypothetical protein BKA70DRAFT_739162 [Coprinopsis sp. MPI-PUGE-AT-0042]|nr:hypothetical protein BKA70DRAFT_739162 [Coprinopsis sp. MPI-PUGE-AT-0042]
MPYWSSELSTFAESLQTEGPFRILDDILAVVIFSGFSVIETRILYRLIRPSNARRSSKSSRSSRLAAVVTITLGLAYVVCAALTLVNFMVKLALVTRYSRGVLDGSSPPACPTGYSLVESWLSLCVSESKANRIRLVIALDVTNAILFQLMLIVSDALLLYRCFILLSKPWSWIITTVATLPLCASFGFLICNFFHRRLDVVAPTYVSLLTNLVTSTTLVFRLWRAKREAEESMGDRLCQAQIPYKRLIGILVESALPPLLLGILHMILFFSLQATVISLNVLLVSFTILAPQSISLRVQKGREHEAQKHTSGQIFTLPIAFKEGSIGGLTTIDESEDGIQDQSKRFTRERSV